MVRARTVNIILRGSIGGRSVKNNRAQSSAGSCIEASEDSTRRDTKIQEMDTVNNHNNRCYKTIGDSKGGPEGHGPLLKNFF